MQGAAAHEKVKWPQSRATALLQSVCAAAGIPIAIHDGCASGKRFETACSAWCIYFILRRADAADVSAVRDEARRLAVRFAVEVVDRFLLLTITVLASGRLRFTALHEQVAGISQRMLSRTLRALTRDDW